VEQLLVLLAAPFRLLDGWVQPLEPASLIEIKGISILVFIGQQGLTLHCLALFLWSREAILDHWFLPYFMTAALRISSSVLRHTPPLIITRGILAAC